MSSNPSATTEKKDELHDSDDLWSFHDGDSDWDSSMPNFNASKRVMVPVFLLCQAVTSLLNLICALALAEISDKFINGQDFRHISMFWLVVSLGNTIAPILMLASVRTEGILCMRLFMLSSCVIFVLLLVSIVQSAIVLTNWMVDPKNQGVSKRKKTIDASDTLTIIGVISGMLVQLASIVITCLSMYSVYELTKVVKERRRSRKKSEKSKTKNIKTVVKRSP